MAWPEENVQRLKQMWAEGVPVRVIAEKLGVNYCVILTKARRMHLGFHPRARPGALSIWNDGTKVVQLRALWANDLPVPEIARRLGVTRSTITGKAHRLGLPEHANVRNRFLKKERVAKPPRERMPPRQRINAPMQYGGVPKQRSRTKAKKLGRLGLFCGAAFPKQSKPPPIMRVCLSDLDIPKRQRRSLERLTNNTCRWPVGDPSTKSFFFCGSMDADNAAGIPYCKLHSKVAYRSNPGRAYG